MAVVEDIELRLTVNATGAQKGLEETRKAAESMGGRIGNLTESFKNLQQKLGPAAAAISGVSAALGQTNGEAGKALAAIGQVAAAFAAGGPFGAAMAAGTFAVDAFNNALEKKNSLQMAAIDAEFAQTDAITKTTRELRQQAESLRLQLEPLSPAEIREQARDRIKELERQRMLNAADAEYARRHDAAKAKSLLEQNNILEEQKQLIFEIADLQARMLERGARAPTAARAPTEPAKPTRDPSLQFLAEFKKQRDQAAAEERGAALAMAFEERDELIEAERMAQQKRTELARDAANKRARIAKDEQQATIDAVTGGLSTVVGAFQGYVEARVKGEEDAEAAFVASIMRQAGQALISYGTQAIGRGILEASSPLTAPLAAASFTAGAGLIAGGVALGGAAAGISAAGATAAAPSQSTSGGGADLGARARPTRPGAAGSGGTNLTIVYGGLSGPSADDGARALGRGLERARRRGLAL